MHVVGRHIAPEISNYSKGKPRNWLTNYTTLSFLMNDQLYRDGHHALGDVQNFSLENSYSHFIKDKTCAGMNKHNYNCANNLDLPHKSKQLLTIFFAFVLPLFCST